jgi:hypothetical protein
MPAVPLKPEYGPTLGQLLAPRWQRGSRRSRVFVVLVLLVVVALLLGAALTLENAQYAHGGPVPFSFSYRDLYRRIPAADEYVRVQSRSRAGLSDSFAVGPLMLPAYTVPLNVELPLYAAAYIPRLSRRYEAFQLRGEGETKVNTVPAYEILYDARVNGRAMYGRDILLLPERHHPRAGVFITMLSSPAMNPGVTSPMLVGTTGVLELPVETFTIG